MPDKDEMEKQRVLLSLDADAANLLEQLTTERKKGEYVSQLIRRATQAVDTPGDGILERLEKRLTRIEALLEKVVKANNE